MDNNISFKRFLADIQGVPYKRTDLRTSHGKSGKSGKMHTKFQHAHFICWDGEGITDTTKRSSIKYKLFSTVPKEITEYQVYALLMNNEGKVKINMQGLTTHECLEMLLTSTDDKRAIHVCFGSSYDANMMLRNLSETSLRDLHAGRTVDYGKYRIRFRAHKSLEIWEYNTVNQKRLFNKKTQRWEGWYKRSLVLWDVFGFFQCSFVEALDKYFVRGNQLPNEKQRYKDIIEKIKEGKDKRGTFTESEMNDFIMPYCKLEVDALHDLMHRLHGHLQEAEMNITRWDGAGACATSLLQKYNVKPHIQEHDIPSQVVNAAEYAFFGGRIEVLRYGNYEGTVYHKDINSAYPDAMKDLPSLKDGHWEHMGLEANDHPLWQFSDVSLFLVSWYMPGQNTVCPFPWRDKIGNVYFPSMGKAWVWLPELLMAKECFSNCYIHIHEAWNFTPGNDVQPYAFIPEVYEYRKELIRRGSGAEKVLKLGLNSLYGKTAQSVGYSTDREMGKPPYHNLVIAGMTTSRTRARLMRAAMQHPESIIMLATDGIYSTSDIDVPGRDAQEKVLGQWEHSTHDYITIVASGVYWYKSSNEDENSFSRGFNKYSLMRDMILEAWRKDEIDLDCETTRFVGLGSAIGLNNFNLWCTWRTVLRTLGLNMDKVAKRIDNGIEKLQLAYSLHSTYAAIPKQLQFVDSKNIHKMGSVAMSHKYVFSWDTKRDDILDGVSMRQYLEEVANSRA